MKRFTLERVIAAPPLRVWEAWTDAAAFRQWMGPVGWDVTECAIDLRPGGRWSTTQRSPDGALHPTGGSYLAVEPPHHLAFNWVLTGPDGAVMMEAEHHLRFAPRGTGTALTLEIRILVAGPGSEAFVNGVRDGWTGTLGKLAHFVEG
jgi:uncharacterized protein YndB with AHSA1/START domain